MYPRVRIGSYTIGSFLLLNLVGMLIGIVLAWRLARKAGLSHRHFFAVALGAIASGLFGAHWLHALVNASRYTGRPWDAVFGVWEGRIFLGGPIAAVGFLVVYSRWFRLPCWKVLDVVTPSLALAQVFGRVGCFFAGCCYGVPTACPLGVPLMSRSLRPPEWRGVPLHPVQLYEALGLLLLFHLLLRLARARGNDGRVVLAYFLGYPALRFVLEFYRGDPRGVVGAGLFSTSQFLSLVLFALALLALEWRGKSAPAGGGTAKRPAVADATAARAA